MATSVKPDIIEDLDYEYVPPCEIRSSKALFLPFNRYLLLRKPPPCLDSAAWYLICTCGNAMYVCDSHRQSNLPFGCGRCRRILRGDKANWIKL